MTRGFRLVAAANRNGEKIEEQQLGALDDFRREIVELKRARVAGEVFSY